MSNTTAFGPVTDIRHDTPIEPAVGRALNVEIVRGLRELAGHLWEWRDLASAARGVTVFQTPEFVRAWQIAFAEPEGSESITILVRDQGLLVALAPIRVARWGTLRIARLAGFPIGQYDEVLVRPTHNAATMLQEIGRALREVCGIDIVMFQNVRDDSVLADACRKGGHATGTLKYAPAVDLGDQAAEIYSNGLKKRVRKHLAKCRRELEARGEIEFVIAEDGRKASEWLDEALHLKRQWLCRTGRISRAFMDLRTRDLLMQMAQDLCHAPGPLRTMVSRLSIDGRTAAIEFGFTHRHTYHCYLGAFAPELARYSPGNLLTGEMLRALHAMGITRYDMMAPDARYKREWANGAVPVHDFALALSAQGTIFLRVVLQGLQPAARRAFYFLPARLRAYLACRLVKA